MEKKSKIRIVIADDHQMFLDGLRSLLSAEKNITIVGQATNGVQVLDILGYEAIDVAVIDITMPEMDGYDTVLEMKKKHPKTKVIILSLHKDETHIGKLLKAGVSGYVIKDRGSEELVKAINLVANGESYWDPEVQSVSLKAMQNKKDDPIGEVRFTSREEDIMHLIADGLTTKQIAQKLYISGSTVETHRRHLLEKLNLDNSKLLITYALRKGYGSAPLT